MSDCVHRKCDALETRLAELKAEMASLSAGRSIEGFDGKVRLGPARHVRSLTDLEQVDSMTGLKASSTPTKVCYVLHACWSW
jgi:hypothetical protein